MAYSGNHHPPRAPWFPHHPSRQLSMASAGNHTSLRGPWFPLIPHGRPSVAHPGNHTPFRVAWFPLIPHRWPSMVYPRNHTPSRGTWFPHNLHWRPSIVYSGNQWCRDSGSGQLGTSGGQCRPGLQTARAGYAARHSGRRPSDGTAHCTFSRFFEILLNLRAFGEG